MTMNSFFKGMAAGMIAGAAVTMVAMPKKGNGRMRGGAGRALKIMGEIVENINSVIRD